MKTIGVYNELHPGITMHKIPVKAGFPGVLFTIGMAVVFLMGIPALKYFLMFATVLGIGFAVMLHFIPRQGRVCTPHPGAAGESKKSSSPRKKTVRSQETVSGE